MSKTIRRESCQECRKIGRDNSGNNLCFFLNQFKQETSKCMREECTYNKNRQSSYDLSTETSLKEDVANFNYNQDPAGDFLAIPERGLSEDTCRTFNYKTGVFKDKEVHICECVDPVSKRRTDIKIRFVKDKQFIFHPNQSEETHLIGLHSCKDYSKPLIITEGELDAMSCHQLGYQACSLTRGVNSVRENIELDIEEIQKFKEVWLYFDNDRAGKKALKEAKELLQDCRLYVIQSDEYKDANEALLADELEEVIQNRKEVIPEGIIFGSEVDLDALYEPLPEGVKTGFKKVDEITHGIGKGQLWVFTGGTALGKSTLLRTWAHNFRKKGLKVSNIFIEENERVAQQSYIARELEIPIGNVMENPNIIPKDIWDDVGTKVLKNDDLMFINQRKWKKDTENFIRTCKYLVKVKKYDIIILDHLSAIIRNTKLTNGGQVRDIENFMERLGDLCTETGARILVAVHLKRPHDHPYWDEGKVPQPSDLSGSGSLEQKPDVIIGISRNIQDKVNCDLLQVHILKNRWFSKVGLADQARYFEKTGTLEL
jgi:twinkle protein